jgi:hypothetical protein
LSGRAQRLEGLIDLTADTRRHGTAITGDGFHRRRIGARRICRIGHPLDLLAPVECAFKLRYERCPFQLTIAASAIVKVASNLQIA